MGSAGTIIATNNVMDKNNDDSDDEYEEYRLARKHERSLSKKLIKQRVQNQWVEDLVQQ